MVSLGPRMKKGWSLEARDFDGLVGGICGRQYLPIILRFIRGGAKPEHPRDDTSSPGLRRSPAGYSWRRLVKIVRHSLGGGLHYGARCFWM